MLLPFAILSLGGQLLLVAADEAPRFDVRPSCRGGANSAVSLAKDVEGCVKNETAARDQLAKGWSQFARGDRVRCAEMTRMGGPPSYVELLTCLEIARDVTSIRKDDMNPSKVKP
jgi:hypothetical protein